MTRIRPEDVAVGQRLHALRLANRISQEALGHHLGVTFQQVQKYERGVNRISAGALQRVAELFRCPVSDLVGSGEGAVTKPDHLTFIANPFAADLIPAFNAMSREMQKAVRDMIVALGRYSHGVS